MVFETPGLMAFVLKNLDLMVFVLKTPDLMLVFVLKIPDLKVRILFKKIYGYNQMVHKVSLLILIDYLLTVDSLLTLC